MRVRGQVTNDLSSGGTGIVSEPFLMVWVLKTTDLVSGYPIHQGALHAVACNRANHEVWKSRLEADKKIQYCCL